MTLESIKNKCLVFDIETYAEYYNGREINIMTDFNNYVSYAKCRWFGCYSYKHNKEYYLNISTDYHVVKKLLEEHDILIGFNSEEFDFPILVNNGLINDDKKYLQVDCMSILGANNFKSQSGYSYKNRGSLMNYKFKSNSLKIIAETMKLDFQKGDIDYKIFQKDIWTPEETQEITTYLQNDVMATKQMFEALWNYWKPFTELLDSKSVKNLSWIRNSIASLIYKSACYLLQTEPTYADASLMPKEEMGGRVIEPKYEEAKDIWYIDFTSLYPHIFCMFNLFAETQNDTEWHGNDIFKVKGYYDISKQHLLSKAVQQKLKERIELKKNDKDNPMIYTIKIWLNGLYGIIRSQIFEKVHTPNSGWDCCWLGQQIHQLTEEMMKNFGFETIGGDTDSLFCVATEEHFNNRDYVKSCLEQIIDKILSNVPFPVDTYNIDIEHFLPYMMFPFSEQPIKDLETGKNLKKGNRLIKERKGKKKNYLYVYEKDEELKVELVGLPIKKDNATKFSLKIYNDILKPKILSDLSAKFSKDFIDNIINEYLKDKKILELISIEYKVKPSTSYKRESQIQAQISNGYFNGGSGVIRLIKNHKIGNAGKGTKYCSLEEAEKAELSVEDLDLQKVYNELEPFIKYENNNEK